MNPMASSRNHQEPAYQAPAAGARPGRVAFTLVELLALLATLACLAALLAPALARTRPGAQAYPCLNNYRQLILAWQMYAHDHSDMLVQNFNGGEAQGGSGGE